MGNNPPFCLRKSWIQNDNRVFLGETEAEDYHHDMSIDHFMEWFKRQLLPNIPAHFVIVLNNTKYHNTVVEAKPTTDELRLILRNWFIDIRCSLIEG